MKDKLKNFVQEHGDDLIAYAGVVMSLVGLFLIFFESRPVVGGGLLAVGFMALCHELGKLETPR